MINLLKHDLVKKTILITTSNVLTRVISMIFFVILARALSVADYGLFRYLISVSVLYAIIFTGFPTALTKFIGENKEKKRVIKELVTNTTLLMLISFIIISCAIMLFSNNKLLLILLTFAVLIDTLYTGFVRGLLNYVKLAGFKLLENSIQLVILIISYLIYHTVNFTFAVIFFSVAGIISATIFEIIKPEFKIKLSLLSKKKLRRITKYTIPVLLGSIGWTIMFNVNSVFIEHYYTTIEVGYYSVGFTLVQIFAFLPSAISAILLPKIAGVSDKKKINSYVNFTVFGSIIFSIILLIPFIIFKKELILIIFTDKYLPAIITMMPLAISQIFISIHQIYSSVFQGLGRPGIPSIIITVATIVNIILSYYLISTDGIYGASISAAISSGLAFFLSAAVYFINKKRFTTEQK